MSQEGNRDTLKVVCLLKRRETPSVTSLMLKRELENVKTGQHENTRENVEGEITTNERTTHERTGHATYDPRCETCVKVRRVSTRPRKAVAEAAYFDYAIVINSQKRCTSQDPGWCWTVWRNVCASRTSKWSKIRRSRTVPEGVAHTVWKHSSVLRPRRVLARSCTQYSRKT